MTTPRVPLVRLETLGCRVNQYETQLVKEALVAGGYREAGEGEAADLCVVNTCTVTEQGDAKGRKLIRRLARDNPDTRTIVMGCYATRDPQAVAALPNVAEVVTDKRELPDLLARDGVLHTGPVAMPRGISRFESRKRAYVKVQDGCILRCSYCIIPKVRPGLRSRPVPDIEEEVRRLVDGGHREIVLTGIHVGHFGVDTTRGKSGRKPFRLWHLFRRLDAIPGDWRMRLSSVEAVEVNDDFARAAADCEKLCPQFHPALQSGSDTVLRRMRRRYTAAKFVERCERVRELVPGVTYTTDVIVGFPGETDAEFEQTLEVCRRVGFVKVHAFPFSARRGTAAADLTDPVSPQAKKARQRLLADVEAEGLRMHCEASLGMQRRVLVEGERGDRLHGTDEHFVDVTLPPEAGRVGEFADVTATRFTGGGLEASQLSRFMAQHRPAGRLPHARS